MKSCTKVCDHKTDVRKFASPTAGQGLAYLVVDGWNQVPSKLLIDLVPPFFQLTGLVLIAYRVLGVVVLYRSMTFEAQRNRVIDVVVALLFFRN